MACTPCPLARLPLPVHREPVRGYIKPPRTLEATRTTPSTLPHSPHLSAPPGGRRRRCRRLWPWSSSHRALRCHGRPRSRGRSTSLSLPGHSSRATTHPHVFYVLRTTPRSSPERPLSVTDELLPPMTRTFPARTAPPAAVPEPPHRASVDHRPRRRRSPPAGASPGRSPSPLLLPPSGGTGRLCAVDLRINGHSAFPPRFGNLKICQV